MLACFKTLVEYRELLLILVSRNIKIRYKRSFLGFFWTLLNPVFLIVVYATFLRILRFADPSNRLFLPTLVTGIIVWQFHAMCLNDSLYAVLGNANLVKKTAFPRGILPLSMVLANLVNFVLSLVILVVYLCILRVPCSHVWWLPGIILTQMALCLGLSMALSALNVFFRDTEHLLSVLMLAWFFLTPIIYPFSLTPERFRALAFLNPMTGIVTAYRAVFLSSEIPTPGLVLMSLGISWVACGLGVLIFNRLQPRFADEL